MFIYHGWQTRPTQMLLVPGGLVAWRWENGRAVLEPYNSAKRKKDGTDDIRIAITQSQSVTTETIHRIGPTEAYRTLGAHIRVDGDSATQISKLIEKAQDLSYRIKHSALCSKYRLLAYDTCLLPQLLFPIACMEAPECALRRAQRPGLLMALHTLRVNRHYPRDIVHSRRTYFGLELPDLIVKQGLA